MHYAKLRDYQDTALTQVEESWRAGYRKVLIHMDTGLGKTVIFTTAMKWAFEKGYPSIMAVRGRSLVNQAAERLFKENVPHGVLMANHPLYRPWEKIQIASIDTIRSRGIYPEAKLVVIDEGDLATSDPWHEFTAKYPNAFFLVVTATPYGPKSIAHIVDTVVRPIEFHEAVERGYMVDARYYVPSQPDLTGIKIQNGDYHKGELEDRCNTGELVGDIVKTWLKNSRDKPTVCFAVSIAHSLEIVSKFKDAGINAIHIEASTKDENREKARRGLEDGSVKIVSNVGIWCRGKAIPCLRTIIMARPTRSYTLYVQQLGRGTRPYPGKDHFLVFDHAGNVIRHGFINDQPEACIDGRQKRKMNFKRTSICKICFMAFQSAYCPACGKPQVVESRLPNTVEGELVEIKTDDIKTYLQQLKSRQQFNGYKKNWVWYKLRDKYGEYQADKHFPIKRGVCSLNLKQVEELLNGK